MKVERLEQRRLFAATVAEGYPGFYDVTGTDGPDTIEVSVSMGDGTFTVDGVTYSGVEHISLLTGEGDDIIRVTSDGFGFVGCDIDAGGGNDDVTLTFDGGIWAGPGNDVVRLSDSFRGQACGDAGDDTIIVSGECPDAEIRGGDGNDFIDARANNYGVVIFGGAGADVIYGSEYDDQLHGDGGGGNEIHGMGGNDTIFTTCGADRVYGGSGFDIAYRTSNGGLSEEVEQVLYY